MSIKLKNIYICENVIVSFNGQLSLINITQEIISTAFPAMHPKLTVLISTVGEEGTYGEKVEIISLNNDESIASIEGKAEIKSQGGNNFLANFINVIFKEPGRYWIKITIDNNVVTNEKDHSIIVKKI